MELLEYLLESLDKTKRVQTVELARMIGDFPTSCPFDVGAAFLQWVIQLEKHALYFRKKGL
ncbi:hypothetical protein PCURB6_43250 [Paenibacillus curdlanolyticus]|nr:hypothetical protein PCURB6_43250 [Paenibacillus curdlanolyticus]